MSLLDFFAVFGLLFSLLIYLANSIFAQRLIHIHLTKALVYMSIAGLVAPIGEYIVNSVSVFLFDSPIFLYHVAPVHHGYTSLVMLALWPTYGFHFYCFHQVLGVRKDRQFTDAILAVIMGIDGIVMETIVNLLSVGIFSVNIFYYVPKDLFHVSSIVILPVYVTIGFLGLKIIRHVENKKHGLIYVCLAFAANIMFFLLG